MLKIKIKNRNPAAGQGRRGFLPEIIKNKDF